MSTKNRTIIVSLAIFAMCIIFAIIWGKIFHLNFEPATFINEIFKFLFSIISIVISFSLGQLYWKNRERALKQAKIDNFLLHFSKNWSKQIDQVKTNIGNFEPQGLNYELFDKIKEQLVGLTENLERFSIIYQLLFDIELEIELSGVFDFINFNRSLLKKMDTSAQHNNMEQLQRYVNNIKQLSIRKIND